MLFSRARSGAATSTTPTAGCCSTASRKSCWPKTMRWSSCPATCSRARSAASAGLTHFCRGGILPALGGRGKPRPYGSRARSAASAGLTHFCRGGILPALGGRGKPRPYGSRARSAASAGLTHFCRGGILPALGGRGKPRPYGLSRPRQQLVVVLTHGRRHLVEAAQLLRGVDAKRRGAEALIFDAGAIVGPEPDAIALHHAEHAALPVQGPTAHVRPVLHLAQRRQRLQQARDEAGHPPIL